MTPMNLSLTTANLSASVRKITQDLRAKGIDLRMEDGQDGDTGTAPITLTGDVLVQLPGMDKPVRASDLMTATTHSQKVQALHKQYAGAQQLMDILQDPEGAEEFTAHLLQQGYGRAAIQALLSGDGEGDDDESPAAGSRPTPGRGAPAQGGSPSDPLIASLSQQVQQLTQVIAQMQARGEIDQELSVLRGKNPNLDPTKLLQVAAEKQQSFRLEDAARLLRADELEEQIKAKEKEIADLRVRAALAPEIGLPGGQSVAPNRTRVRDRKAAESLMANILRNQLGKAAQNG